MFRMSDNVSDGFEAEYLTKYVDKDLTDLLAEVSRVSSFQKI